jgi:hypothetical protein
MLRGECMPAFLVCCPPQALRPQDGPGCASPADGDPCRTRTCVRCVRGSRPTARRTGHVLLPWGRWRVRNPSLSTPTPVFGTGAGQSSSTFESMVSPVRFERTTPCLRRAGVPLSYGQMAPEAKLKLTTGASRAPVLFATPPGFDTVRRTASAAYVTRTRTSRLDGPALFHRAHVPGGTPCP